MILHFFNQKVELHHKRQFYDNCLGGVLLVQVYFNQLDLNVPKLLPHNKGISNGEKILKYFSFPF